MRYIILASLALLFVVSPQAQAATMAETLVRMDAIIKEMQALRSEFATLSEAVPTKPATAVLGAQSKSFFTQSLEPGETNSDIKKIQKLLATDPEIYPYGVASGFFGPKTEEGIKNFQTRFDMDPVGVVGPATKALFELFFAAYPDDIYPADVLKKKPTVLGATVTVPPATNPTPTPTQTPTVATPNTGGLSSILAIREDEEAEVRLIYSDGTRKVFIASGSSNSEVVNSIATRTKLSKATILGLITFKDASDNSDEDEDEGDNENDEEQEAEDAIAKAKNTINNVDDAIDEADEDVDTDDAEDLLDEAKDALKDARDALDEEDYEDALDFAKEARSLAKDAEDALEEAEDEA